MELCGRWRAATSDESLRRSFTEPGLDDRAWAEVDVPGHWRSAPGLESSDGPVLYRHAFEAPRPAPGQRVFLVFDGIFYQADVWLDGSYVGDTEGYFAPHAFEVTDSLAERTEHMLAVEVACAPQNDRRAKRNLTGVFQHWSCGDPDWNPGGIWRPVHLETTGAVRIAALRVRCAEASPERAALDITAVLDAAAAATVELSTTLGGPGHGKLRRAEHRLAEGRNVVSWKAYVDQPRLWWPRSLGQPALMDVAVDVTRMDDAQPSHRRVVTTGIRAVRMHRWVLEVNGERLFAKGANQGPTRMALAEATPEELERDVVLAQEAGLDLLRIHAHITRPELYDAADRHGLLLWQDLPLQWTYYRGIRSQAMSQAAQAVDLLAHHPSVAMWCAHDEPVAVDRPAGVSAAKVLRLAGELVLPTWNKTVLDSSLKRALEKADGSRPVVAHSGMRPHPGSGDSHMYFGWYHGDERQFPAAMRALPVLARWVGEFGAQALPSGRPAFMEPHRWPDLDWEHLAHTHNLDKTAFDRYVPPGEYPTFEAWRDATQAYQAELIRHHVEALRRLKYRPTGGFCQFCFADSHPAVSWSVLDHERVPKAGFEALQAACAPVIVTADRPARSYPPGSVLALDVHVVSDLRTPLTAGRVSAVMAWPGGEQRWAWAGDIGADSVERIGRVTLQVPDAPGPLSLHLALEAKSVRVENHYTSEVR